MASLRRGDRDAAEGPAEQDLSGLRRDSGEYSIVTYRQRCARDHCDD
jgi:hypothetical protein